MSKNEPKIILIHSGVRSYRVPLFENLNRLYEIQFYFTHSAGWVKRDFSEPKSWQYKNLKQYKFIGYSSDFSPGLIKELIKKRKDYDIIISSGLSSFATHSSFLIAKILRKKFIVWAEDWVWSKNFWFKIALPYTKLIVRQAHGSIVAGTKTKEFYLKLGAETEKVFIAPNCALDLSKLKIDQEKLKKLRKKINPQNKIVISYLGRIVGYKALDTLIEAFSRLEKERNDVLLLIVGDGPFAPCCQELIEKFGLKNFYWPQYKQLTAKKEIEPIPRSEIIYYFHLTDIFVLPGRFIWKDNVPCEAWGLTLNEAMSLSKPIISTNSVAGAYELIKNKTNGFRIKENDPVELYTALTKTLNENLQTLGENSRKIIEKEFTYDKMLKGFKWAIKKVSKNYV